MSKEKETFWKRSIKRVNTALINRIRYYLRRYLWPIIERTSFKRERAKLNNSGFTLLSCNCMGGVIYHHLGLQFDSPTVSLAIKQPEFCMFCSDLNYYLNAELCFFDCDETFPCAYLGDGEKKITIEFRHYKDNDEARFKWEERKKRVHWDNLYVILNDGNGLTLDNIKMLENCKYKRKIIFTSRKRPEIDNSFYLHTLSKFDDANNVQAERHPITGKWPWEKEFDYVAWLNDEKKFRKKF